MIIQVCAFEEFQTRVNSLTPGLRLRRNQVALAPRAAAAICGT